MTVTTSTARVVHNGNGVTVAFAVPFRFLANDDVLAVLRDVNDVETTWIETTDYTLTGAGSPSGGTLTANVAPLTGETLVIVRDVEITQDSDYVENDDLPAETLEADFDKAAMINQQQSERLNRTVSVPETDSFVGSFVLPIDTDRANLFAAYDNLGGPIAAAGTSADLTPVSTFVNDNILGAASAAALRTAIGSTTVGDAVFVAVDAKAAQDAIDFDQAAWLAGQLYG